MIAVDGRPRAVLRFVLNVVAQVSLSPAITPPSEIVEMHGELTLFPRPFPLPSHKAHHFFICHHQGSGGDQSLSLCLRLRELGFEVWYDNEMKSDERNSDAFPLPILTPRLAPTWTLPLMPAGAP
jgi:hypothetical protein